MSAPVNARVPGRLPSRQNGPSKYRAAGVLAGVLALVLAVRADAERTGQDGATVVVVAPRAVSGRAVPSTGTGGGVAPNLLPRAGLQVGVLGRLSEAPLGLVASQNGLFAITTRGNAMTYTRGASVGSFATTILPGGVPTYLDGTRAIVRGVQGICTLATTAEAPQAALSKLGRGFQEATPLPATCVPAPGNRASAVPLVVTPSGSLLAFDYLQATLMSRDGEQTAHVTVPDGTPVASAVYGSKAYFFLAVSNGDLIAYEWGFAGDLRRLGSFGGRASSGVTLFEGRAFATVDDASVVSMDLATGATTPVFSPSNGLVLGAPAVSSHGVVVLVENAGRTVGVEIDFRGAETRRWPLGPSSYAGSDAGTDGGLGTPSPHAGPVVDSTGSFAFATALGAVGVAHSDGTVVLLDESPCGSFGKPVHLLAGAADEFYLACNTGEVARIFSK